MIQCEYWDIWFHISIVNVALSDALDMDKHNSLGCTGATSS